MIISLQKIGDNINFIETYFTLLYFNGGTSLLSSPLTAMRVGLLNWLEKKL